MSDATPLVVHIRAAELLERHLLAGGDLDDIRTGDEHVPDLAHHEDEVGHRGRVHGPARARSGDQRQLRDHTTRRHVAIEDLRVSRQRDDALLDTRATRVIDTDARTAGAQREIHDLGDLLREHLAERAAEHGRVMAEHEDLPASDRSPAGDHPVTADPPIVHIEVGRAVEREHVELGERASIEHPVDALARGELALGVLRALRGTAPMHGVVAPFTKQVDLLPSAVTSAARRSCFGIERHRNAGGNDRIARPGGGNALARLSGHRVRLPGSACGFGVIP